MLRRRESMEAAAQRAGTPGSSTQQDSASLLPSEGCNCEVVHDRLRVTGVALQRRCEVYGTAAAEGVDCAGHGRRGFNGLGTGEPRKRKLARRRRIAGGDRLPDVIDPFVEKRARRAERRLSTSQLDLGCSALRHRFSV